MDEEKELTTYLRAIKLEKSEKLVPENIKSGVKFLGVTGILESDGTVTLAEYDDDLELCKNILGRELDDGGEV